ncbi:MAG: hypothetical protein QOD90_5967 [Mycobacterium sp.]|jgi:hypothetical protein|nr:hypothetical protein [Mycobacterium sp.]
MEKPGFVRRKPPATNARLTEVVLTAALRRIGDSNAAREHVVAGINTCPVDALKLTGDC